VRNLGSMRKLATALCVLLAMLAVVAPAAADDGIKLPKSDVPVTLDDAGSFDVDVKASTPTPEEISENRRELVSSVSAEKFVEGVSLAITLWWIF